MEMKKLIFFIGIILVVIIFNCCRIACVPNHYTFKIDNCIFQPNKDSIKVGDTLFFTASTLTTMVNQSDGKSIDYSGAANLGSALGVTELVGPNIANDAVNAFSYLPIKGQIYSDAAASPNRIKQIKFQEENGNYKLSFVVVAKKRGIYALNIADMPDVVRKCDRSAISMTFPSSLDVHLHYLKDIYYGGGQINPFDSVGVYCFKVN